MKTSTIVSFLVVKKRAFSVVKCFVSTRTGNRFNLLLIKYQYFQVMWEDYPRLT